MAITEAENSCHSYADYWNQTDKTGSESKAEGKTRRRPHWNRCRINILILRLLPEFFHKNGFLQAARVFKELPSVLFIWRKRKTMRKQRRI